MEESFLLAIVAWQPFGLEAWIALGIALLSLVGAVWVSVCNAAFSQLTPHEIHEFETATNKSSEALVARLMNKSESLSALFALMRLFFITFFFLAIAVVLVYVADLSAAYVWMLIPVGLLGYLLLVFIDLLFSRVLASKLSWRICVSSARTLWVFRWLFRPLVELLSRFWNDRSRNKSSKMSYEELSEVLEYSDEMKDDKEILESVIRFGDISVNNVMTSRLDLVAVEEKTSFADVIACFIESGYSRLPVYESTYDQIRGMLYLKDIVPYMNQSDDFAWQPIARPAVFIPETRKLDDLLQDFKRLKVHVAIVVDEFGSTLGIVTMEDVLEEIVGDINDEYDEDEHLFTKVDDSTYDFEGKIQLNDFFKATGIDEDEFGESTSDVETLAGLVLELKGGFPHVHEQIVFGRYTFEILAMDRRRIHRVRLTIEPDNALESVV